MPSSPSRSNCSTRAGRRARVTAGPLGTATPGVGDEPEIRGVVRVSPLPLGADRYLDRKMEEPG